MSVGACNYQEHKTSSARTTIGASMFNTCSQNQPVKTWQIYAMSIDVHHSMRSNGPRLQPLSCLW
eukprot:5042119-Amphidinium_carterae.1